MRIRRFTEGKEFWSNLEAETSDVLPIWFAEAERDWIARTVAPQVAMLAAGNEYSFANCGIRCGSDDWVLAAPSGPETLLARRYAAATARPLMLTDGHSVPAAFAGRTPRSLTWFCQLDERDIPGALDALCRTLNSAFGKVPPLGVLTAEDAVKLSWLMAKQVLPQGDYEIAAATLISLTEPTPQSSLVHLGRTHTMAEVVAAMHRAAGTLLINAHSRPHCGILKVADGAMGICGLETGGAGGRCVGGTDCFFGDGPRAVVQNFQSRRVFFNGCTTAGVGTHRLDLLPRTAMVSHAALRGAAREFIGNVWPGLYDETDLDWFLGASALGYTPAECVQVLATARASTERETVRSALYFGDATNAAWPVDGVAIGDVAMEKDGGRIRWRCAERLLVARMPGRVWADLAGCDRLYAATPHPSQPTISVIADPFCAASIVLAVPRTATAEPPTEIEITLGPLAEPIDRSVGGALAAAIAHIGWLETLPAFGQLLANASRQLDEQLVTLRRTAGSRADLAMLPHLLAYLRNMEDEAARRFDGLIIDEVLVRSQGYWNWQMEYGPRVKATPRKHPSPCPFCAASANDIDYVDWANPSMRRTSKACGYCGILADLPTWDLRLRFVPETLVASTMELKGTAEVANDGDRPRRVTLGVVVERAGEVQPESLRKDEVLVAPGKTSSFAFSLIPAKPMSEIYQLRLYGASEGAFAALSTFVLCPPQAERGTPGD